MALSRHSFETGNWEKTNKPNGVESAMTPRARQVGVVVLFGLVSEEPGLIAVGNCEKHWFPDYLATRGD